MKKKFQLTLLILISLLAIQTFYYDFAHSNNGNLARIIKDFKNKNVRDRLWAIKDFKKIDRSVAFNSIDQLISLLKDADKNVRQFATSSLGELFIKAYRYDKNITYISIDKPTRLKGVKNSNKAAKKAVNALILMLDDPIKQIRIKAMISLGLIGKKASVAIPHLIRMSKKKKQSIRLQAITTMGHIGHPRNKIISFLQNLLHDRDEWVQKAAKRSIIMIEGR